MLNSPVTMTTKIQTNQLDLATIEEEKVDFEEVEQVIMKPIRRPRDEDLTNF